MGSSKVNITLESIDGQTCYRIGEETFSFLTFAIMRALELNLQPVLN